MIEMYVPTKDRLDYLANDNNKIRGDIKSSDVFGG